MLPDLRIVIAAIVSTFVLTVGVGFYASSRLINEPKKSTDSLATLDSTPVNRIALSWPAPSPQSEPLALDFAVTARALRNPVRDIPNESPVIERQIESQTPPVRTTATDLAVPLTEKPVVNRPEASAPAPAEVAPVEVKPVEAAAPDVPPPPAVLSEAPKPAPEPDIRVAVQYPPILELPPELQAPVVPVAPAVAAVEVPPEPPVTTGTIAPTATETENEAAAPADKASEVRIASRPDPADAGATDDRLIETIPVPKPAPKLKPATTTAKKAAAKKVAPKRVVRRPVRRAAPAAPPPVPNFFTMFGTPQR